MNYLIHPFSSNVQLWPTVLLLKLKSMICYSPAAVLH